MYAIRSYYGAALVTPGNFNDDLAQLTGVDWVVEAVVERLDIKTALFAKLAPHLKPGAFLTTNTSGLSVNAMAGLWNVNIGYGNQELPQVAFDQMSKLAYTSGFAGTIV